MSTIQKAPLRELTLQEEQALQKLAKSTSERLNVVKRASALLCVRAGKSYTETAKVAGYKSNDTVSRLVNRFNQGGLPALSIAVGRGRKPTYTSAQQTRILTEVQCSPDRKEDETRTWCRTGYALRKRKSGTVTVYDPETRGAKKSNRVGVRACRSCRDCATQRR